MSVSNKLLYISVFYKSLSRIASSHLPHNNATEWVVILSSLGRWEKLGTRYLRNLPKMEELRRALAWVVQITPEPAPWILFTFLHSGPTSLCFGSSKMALKSSIYSLHTPRARALVLVSCTLSKTQHRCSEWEKEQIHLSIHQGSMLGWGNWALSTLTTMNTSAQSPETNRCS